MRVRRESGPGLLVPALSGPGSVPWAGATSLSFLARVSWTQLVNRNLKLSVLFVN